MTESIASRLGPRYKNVISFSTNILIVGGSYSGLAALNSLLLHFRERMKHSQYREKLKDRKVSVTLVEPRAGLLNILGIPKAIVDPEFAETQFIPFEELKGLHFNSVVSSDEATLESLSPKSESVNTEAGLEINFIHGKVKYLDTKKVQYVLNEGEEKALIDFDYVIFASGRNRSWPTTPEAYTKSYFIKEMQKSMAQQRDHEIVTIIGAGAVGVELAGDIKYAFPDKTVNLVHPHQDCPPEPLSDDFKEKVGYSLESAGINLYFNTRIEKELENGDLLTHSGKIIESSLNHWCSKHKNNVDPLSTDLKKSFVTPKNDISVNEFLQLHNRDRTISNFFVLGDLVDLPIIKSAGWAMYMGRQVANNLTSYIFDGHFVEPFPDLSTMPRGMVLVTGNGELISELSGVVEINNETYTHEYKDYCVGKIRATLGL